MIPSPGRYQYPTSLKAISLDSGRSIGHVRRWYLLYFPNTSRRQLSNTAKMPPLLASLLYERVVSCTKRATSC